MLAQFPSSLVAWFNPNGRYVNKINVTFSISMMADDDEGWQRRYFTIYAKNIVQYPDGSIGWGKDDPKDLSFEHNIDWNNM